MLFFTQIKLANIDKKITTNLKVSKWYRTNNSKDIYSLSLKGIDRSEQWVKDVERLGAGEILLTSMDADGTRAGFDIELTKKVCEEVRIPVIASGGCGDISHFHQVFVETNVDAALAASLFHFRELTIAQVKEYLKNRGIPVRVG